MYCQKCNQVMPNFQDFVICFHSPNIWKLLQGQVNLEKTINIVADPGDHV